MRALTTREDRLAEDGAENPILFYRQNDPEWGWLSSFAYIPILIPHPWFRYLALYETREHYFQASKAITAEAHEFVRGQEQPGQAKRMGKQIRLRSDWGNKKGDICWHVMVESIVALCLQHIDVLDKLRATGDRHIYEDSPNDDIWGWHKAGSYHGSNLLGEGWMHVRSLFFPAVSPLDAA